MAIQISSTFDVNRNIKTPIVDSSYVKGATIYANSYAELPKDTVRVKPGNIGVVVNATTGKVVNYYTASLTTVQGTGEKVIFWSVMNTGSSDSSSDSSGNTGSGIDEVYYTDDDAFSDKLIDSPDQLPDEFLVVNDEEATDNLDGSTLFTSLVAAISKLQKEVTKMKNAMNFQHGLNIEDADSNYGTSLQSDTQETTFYGNSILHGGDEPYAELSQKTYSTPTPCVEVDWEDSSNNENVFDGNCIKYGSAEDASDSSSIKVIDSSAWIDVDSSTVVYNTSVFDGSNFPYYSLDASGAEPSTNVCLSASGTSDADDSSFFPFRHFTLKYAATKTVMDKYMEYLNPYEPVLCISTWTLYVYDPTKNKMRALAGSGSDNNDSSDSSDASTNDDNIEKLMAELLHLFTDGSVNEIVMSDIDMDASIDGAKKYSVSITNGNVSVVEKTGTQLTSAVADSSWTYYSTADTVKYNMEINELYANDTSLYTENYAHNTSVPVSHNFIEISNLDPEKTVDLSNMYLQYYDLTNNKWYSHHLRGHINPGSTYLVRGAQVAPENAPSTIIDVSTFDEEWYDNNKLLAFNNANGCMLLTMDSSVWSDSAASQSGNTPVTHFRTSPALTATYVPKDYVDLIGWGASNTEFAECNVAFTNTSISTMIIRRNMMDRSTQARPKGLSKHTNAGNKGKYVEPLDVTANHFDNIKDFRPRASFENKNIYTTRSDFRESRPYCVTVTFGIDPTSTRCFNWISPGVNDEFVFWRKKGDTTWNIKESYTENDGQDSSWRTIEQTDAESTVHSIHVPCYDRIYWETSGHTFVTTHKVILRNLENAISYYTSADLSTSSKSATDYTKGQLYEYRVGQAVYDRYGNATGPSDSLCSEISEFQVRPAVTNRKWSFIQHTDQQGFTWLEYEVWRRTANIIRTQFNPQFTINTGDMTQNGNRLSEWIDYNVGAEALTKGGEFTSKLNGSSVTTQSAGVEQMNVVGNNDLCPVSVYLLGTGADAGTSLTAVAGKASAEQFKFFYTYEIDLANFPGTISDYAVQSWIPSLYSFNYNNCHFVGICSELTNTAAVSIYGEDASHLNSTDAFSSDAGRSGYLYPKTCDLIENWVQADLNKNYKYSLTPAATAIYPWAVCYMHEMPFTILTAAVAKTDSDYTTGSGQRTAGCKLNDNASLQFHMSEIFQNNHVRLVIGGHKHTHSQTWPLLENVMYSVDGVAKHSWELTSTQLSDETIIGTRTVDSRHPYVVLPYDAGDTLKTIYTSGVAVSGDSTRFGKNGTAAIMTNNATDWAPVYVMSQASANKVISNKEKPAPGVPWFKWFYPALADDSNVNGKQKAPHFVEYVFDPNTENSALMNAGDIQVNHYSVWRDTAKTISIANFLGYIKYWSYPEASDIDASFAPMTYCDNATACTGNPGTTIQFTSTFDTSFTLLNS